MRTELADVWVGASDISTHRRVVWKVE